MGEPENKASAGADSPGHGLAAYRRVLSAPRVLSMALASLFARLPLGMGSVAIVLYVQHQTGSFAAAGLAAGAFTIGIGLTGPPQARLIDRRGPRFVLLPAALVSSAALVALVLLGNAGASPAVLAVAAGVAGAGSPPLGGVLRQRWPELVDAHDLPTIYAVDSILIEILFLVGPLLAGLLTATVAAGAGPVAAGAICAFGAVWFFLIDDDNAVVQERKGPAGLAGALASPTIRLLVLTGLPAGAILGALDVALPAFGAAHGNAALGGPFTAAIAVGSLLGGLAYGARPTIFCSTDEAFTRLSAIQLLTCLPLLLVAAVPEMFVAAAIAGLCLAALMNVRFQLAQLGLEGDLGASKTEAFTWVVLALTVGTSLGSAISGPLVQHWGWQAGAVAACAFPAIALTLALLGRDALPCDPENHLAAEG